MSNAISKVLTDVIDEFFIKQEISLDILIIEPISQNYPDIIDLTLTKINKSKPHFVRTFNPKKTEYISINSSAVIFVDWYMQKNLSLRKIIAVQKADTIDLRFLLYFINCAKINENITFGNDESKSNALFWYSFIICHQNYKTLNLLTYEWFESRKCNKRQTKILNSFDLEIIIWKNPLKNYKKFKNFNHCHFEIDLKHFDISMPLKNISIIDAVAEKLNFTFQFGKNSIFSLIPGYLTIYDYFSVTTSFKESKISLLVTEGEAYTNYEKLLLPFDELTWIFLLSTFAFAFMLIFCINRMNKQVKEIFFGKCVTMPSFNVVGTFFGIGQTRLPEANFSRFILMMFIIFCLIFRTAYQGVLFEFMNTDMRKPHAKTIDEVFQKNFTIFLHRSIDASLFLKYIEEVEEKAMNFEIIQSSNIHEDICKIMIENKPKTAIVVGDILLMIVNSICEKKPIKIHETYMTIPVGLATESLHFMFENIEDTIQWLIPSGIIKQSEDFYYWVLYGKNHFEIDDGPKILTMSDLSYGFNIWLITCLATIFEFFIEILVHRIKSRKQIKVEQSKVVEEKDEVKIGEENLEENHEATKKLKSEESSETTESKEQKIIEEAGTNIEPNENLEIVKENELKSDANLSEDKNETKIVKDDAMEEQKINESQEMKIDDLKVVNLEED
ncbi:hypothetical protein PVAND_001039 [Polypedilum vanderplanki]|uniref:Uncharacterized protein n=1 Tax=Polypedilum vanderplanki TaxID=319348 RepID=A0A9J6BLQ5_POLVA|nr:hypothetical protein PVAND_001039 [Polypedilum vanderplanki]